MDDRQFDTFTRALSEAGSRRGLLATLPLLGGLFALLDRSEFEAEARRKRRKKPHHHRKKTGNRAGKKKKRRCNPESKAKTCSGKCGLVTNNCKQTIDCGSCDCPEPCKPCFTCRSGPNTPGSCVPDPEQVGDPCGDPGQRCQADGACECQAGSCQNPTPICSAGECVGCSQSEPCPHGCCAADGTCHEGTQNTACGFPGGQCANCVAKGEVCSDRACFCNSGVTCSANSCCPNSRDVCDGDDQCCAPASPCAGVCGTVGDNCDQDVNCTAQCAGCCNGATCLAVASQTNDQCGTEGAACTACSGASPVCVDGSCQSCSATNRCPAGQCCQGGQCVASCPECQTCSDGVCVADGSAQGSCCGTANGGTWCQNGSCVLPTGSLAECQSRCDTSIPICGHSVTCPACSTCGALGCWSTSSLCDGSAGGTGRYCTRPPGFPIRCQTGADCSGLCCSGFCKPPCIE